jgi:hypothetical protein
MFATRQRLQGRIERLLVRARRTTDDELQAELARYLCILVSSLIEERCRERASTFADVRSAPEITRFVRAQMRRFRSPSAANIRDFFSGFDPVRANGWYEGLADDQRDALDSIVANRNQLAHGVSVGLSLGMLTSYTERAGKAMSELDRQFG